MVCVCCAGTFNETKGWEDTFEHRHVENYTHFYSAKDNLFPTKAGGTRRVSWGGHTLPDSRGAHTMPRTVTFNPVARVLEQAPLEELEQLRGPAAANETGLQISRGVPLDLVRTTKKEKSFSFDAVLCLFRGCLG